MAGRPGRDTYQAKDKTDGKRRDQNRAILKTGEYQRTDGRYSYRWTDRTGKRKTIYATSLKELREKEQDLQREILDGIRTMDNVTLNDMYDLWLRVKRGLKDNTIQNYKFYYEQYVKDELGRYTVRRIKKSDIRSFYNRLIDEGRLRVRTIDVIQNVLHQVLQIAVDDGYIRSNPSDGAFKELKKVKGVDARKHKALSMKEQDALLNYLRYDGKYERWYPIIAFMIGTGMRVGEVTGLRWIDVDIDRGLIDVNHTLVYYDHGNSHCAYEINTTKTPSSMRIVPMLSMVKEALLMEKEQQGKNRIICTARIAGYTDFVFLNRYGYVHNHSSINKVLYRVVRDYNEKQVDLVSEGKLKEEDMILLPRFSCHSLRHTFATRMVELGVNVKVVQETLGHADVATTLNIYAKATEELKLKEFDMLDIKMNSPMELNQ